MYVSVDDEITDTGAIEVDKGSVRTEAYSLPAQFMWDNVDLQDERQVCRHLSHSLPSHTPSLSLTPSLTHIHPPYLSHPLSHTHTPSLSLTHPPSHTHTPSLYLSSCPNCISCSMRTMWKMMITCFDLTTRVSSFIGLYSRPVGRNNGTVE